MHQAGGGIGIQRFQAALQAMWQPDVIAIEERNELAAGGSNTGIPGRRHAPVGLMDVLQFVL